MANNFNRLKLLNRSHGYEHKNLPVYTNNILNLISFFNSISNNNVNASSDNVLSKLKTISNFNQSQNAIFNLSHNPFDGEDMNDINNINNNNNYIENNMENDFMKRYYENLEKDQPPIPEKPILNKTQFPRESNIMVSPEIKPPNEYAPYINKTKTFDGRIAIINTSKKDDSNKSKLIFMNNLMVNKSPSYNDDFQSNN